MRPFPASRCFAALALSALLACAGPPAASAGQRDDLPLALSYELTLEPPAQKPAPAPDAGEALALAPIRALAAPAASGKTPPAVPLWTSPTLAAVLASILAFLAAGIAALVAFSLWTRFARERRRARDERFRARWEPLLYARMAGDDAPLPRLERSERLRFLSLWLHMLGYVRDEAAEALMQAANDLDLPRQVLKLLESRAPWQRLLAVRAAGMLRLEEATAPLLRKAAQRRPRSSLAAASALLRIDPRKGFPALQNLLAHLEWSPGAIAGIVKEGGEAATQMLAGLLASMPAGGAKQVVRLIELLDDPGALPALRARLLSNRDEEEVAVILHALGKLGGREDRAAILLFLAHRSWLVRMQAATALGRIGFPEDRERLAPLLRDAQWWVRYRAAQALLKLGGAEALRALHRAETDRYALEILDRALAEG